MELRRVLQSLAVRINLFIFFKLSTYSFCAFVLLIIYSSLIWRMLALAYLAFIFYQQSQNRGYVNGNGCKLLRNNLLFKLVREYFPVDLVKTAELTPDRNYLLASFPHGFLSMGGLNILTNNIEIWDKIFPGVRPKLATLPINSFIPFWREFQRYFGFVSVSKKSLLYYLSKSNDSDHSDNKDGFTSNAVSVLVGGVEEMFSESHQIVVKNRKGFVKLAIETGSSIVPTFSFNEAAILDPPKRCASNKSLNELLFLLKLSFCSWTIMPRRKRVTLVVGAPIEVRKSSSHSIDPKYVDEIHQKVVAAVQDLFETHKATYLENYENVKLVIR